MSAISHKLDAKEVAGGKGKADGANKAETKKLAAAAAGGQPVDGQPATEDGAQPISKKEAKKQAKKDEKKAKKTQGKPDAPVDGAKPTEESAKTDWKWD